MSSVTLKDLWLHRLDDFDDYRRFRITDINSSEAADTRVVKMATGRHVSIRTPGITRTWEVNVRYIDREDRDWLTGANGDTFMVRTPHGGKFFARLHGLEVNEERLPGTPHSTKVGQVSFTLSELTYTEEV